MDRGILVVDDSAFIRVTIKSLIERAGFKLLGEASNGKQAVEKFKALNPDVILMDITMPEMSGIDAVKEIMKIDKAAKIIICSALGHEDVVMNAVKAGARSYLVKPVNESRLIDEINRLCG